MSNKKLEKLQLKVKSQEIHRCLMHAAQNSLESSHVTTIKEIAIQSKIITSQDIDYISERKFNASYYEIFGEESPFNLIDKQYLELRFFSKDLPFGLGPFIVLGKLDESHVDFGEEYCWAISNEHFKWIKVNIDFVKSKTNIMSKADCYSWIKAYLDSRRLKRN